MADGDAPQEQGPTKRINWRRGFGRVFWISTAAWWLCAVAWLVANASRPPAREEFEPRCYGALSEGEWHLSCGSRPQHPSPIGAFTAPGVERQRSEDDARRAWEESLNVYASCVAANDVAAIARVRACEERRDSYVGQREIGDAHRTGILLWAAQLLLAIAVIAAVPFALGGLFIALFRLARWVRDGFRPS